jgi:multiple sugar transport system substrate-binding protein
VEAIVAKFNGSQSKVHVDMTIMPGDVLAQKLEISLATGTGPALCQGINGAVQSIPQFAEAGVIQRVDALYGSGGIDKAVFPEAFFTGASYKGHLWGIPMTIQPAALFYNTSMFKAAGIAPPATVAELKAALVKLTAKGISGMPLGTTSTIDWWSPWIWAYGGNYTNATGTKSELASKNTVASFEAWGDLEQIHHISPTDLTGAGGDALFTSKRAATDFTGPWLVSGLQQAKVPFNVIPFPAGPGGSHVLGTGGTILVAKGVTDLEPVRDFVNFWTSPWATLEYAKSGSNSMRLDQEAEVAKLNPFSGKFAKMLPTIRYSMTDIVKYSQAFAVVTNAVEDVEAGKNIPSSLTSASSKLQALL